MIGFVLASGFLLSSIYGVAAGPPPKPVIPAGAVYIMTNHPTGNKVISHTISQNGLLMYGGTFSTGGVGTSVHPSAPSGDPLTAHGSIHVSDDRLYVVNAGSNTISVFAIDPFIPSRISLVGKPIDSKGDFPVSITTHPTTGNICVLNGGTNRNIQCFRPDIRKGLVAIPSIHTPLFFGTNVTTPPASIQDTFSDFTFTPDGKKVIVSDKAHVANGTLIGGSIGAYDVNLRQGGTISASSFQQTFPPGGVVTLSLTHIPGTQAYINTDVQFGGFYVVDFSTGYGSKATVKGFEIPNDDSTIFAEYSKKTGTFWLTDQNSGNITEIAIEKRTLSPSVVRTYQQSTGVLDERIVSIRGVDFLYTVSPGDLSIDVLALIARGKAKTVQEAFFEKPATRDGAVLDPLYFQGLDAYVKPGFS